MDESNAVEQATELVNETATEIKNIFHLDDLASYVTWGNVAKVITSLVAIIIFWIVYRVIRHFARKGLEKSFQKRTTDVVLKAISYCFYVVIVMYVLGLFGIKLSAIWGAAGIAGVAVGFAAQTSVSNLISGIFVLTEKTMKVGDFIEVNGISGTIDSVGLLAVKIHTLDNQLVRIPNSTIINTNLMNYSSFGYRRFSFPLEVAYESDLEKALEVIKKIPEYCPTVIKDKPEYSPAAVYSGMSASGIQIALNVWFKSSDLIQTKNDVYINYMKLCNENGIEVPYIHYDVKILKD